jgi:hypothetical protein
VGSGVSFCIRRSTEIAEAGEDKAAIEKIKLPSTAKALVKTLWFRYIFSLIFQAISAGCMLSQPILLQYFIMYLRLGFFGDNGRDGAWLR